MVIDCHTHWGMGWNERDGTDPSNWISVLDRHGVEKVFLMGHANLVRLDMCESDNNTVADLSARHPDRLIAFGSAWPQMGKHGVREAERCIKQLGMKGLKFHPWLQGFSTADPCFGEICEMAGEMSVPVVFHDGTPCYSLSEQIGGLARRFPRTTFVLGHSGILWNWRSALEAARQPNVWVCLCGPHMRAMEIFCRRIDPDKILWGSDFGFGFSDPIEYRLNLIRNAQIDEGLRSRILEINPLRLLGLCH